MTRFQFALATSADDSDLRYVLSRTPMGGRFRIAFAREPSYFDAAAVDGKIVQVGICRDSVSNRVVGMGSRAVSLRYVNEQQRPVGYLSGLRLLPEYRGQGRLLARGYQFLKELHQDQTTEFYLTTIADQNVAAIQLLTSRRGGLPVYHPHGRFCTLALRPRRVASNGSCNDDKVHCRAGTLSDRNMLLEFWNRQGKLRQFFPVYKSSDLFEAKGGLLKGLRPQDVALAYRGQELVGTLAAWNQRSFKQTIIEGYTLWLAFARPLYNVCAQMMRWPVLPMAGSTLNCAYAAVPVIGSDDAGVFRSLLKWQLNRSAALGLQSLLVGLHEDDPLMPVAREFSRVEYITRLYIVYWPDDMPDLASLTGRVPYLELGSL
jgi:hypothetical protein